MGRWFFSKPGKWVKVLAIGGVIWYCQQALPSECREYSIPAFAMMITGTDRDEDRVFHKRLGARLRMFRESKGVTQVELASACGYNSTGTISQIERGITGMEISKLMLAADRLGIHPAALLTELEMTDEQLQALSKLANAMTHPDKAKNLRAIMDLLKLETEV